MAMRESEEIMIHSNWNSASVNLGLGANRRLILWTSLEYSIANIFLRSKISMVFG